ncbi:hypothetical protein KQI36_15985 [Clostridium senegalense]|uniref:hypothetical protein n=1 Tax=Clostridium senegalense TaxID=1465809 RepID=UPI0014306243|nr:hypothetical protein [Clostridium senegalense]MBU5228132.1 hypothetical protein [Clostridium senegalense]
MAKKKVNNESKELAKTILNVKGIDYDEWLEEKHKEIINENVSLLIESLQVKAN